MNQKILIRNKSYIVGVSGGPDSLFLLDNLRKAGYKVVVAHINYQKRVESNQEEKLVQNYCQKYSLTFEVYQAKELEYNSISNFQDKARKIRYHFFQKLATQYQTKCIVVAHHFDDHLETYLLQKNRNSLVEYWGLSPKNKLEKHWILRPLLFLTKSQIIQYLDQKKISYATDFTNLLPIYQRNIIRTKLKSLNSIEKNNLAKEIEEKNKELKKIKLLVRVAKQEIIIAPDTLQLEKKKYPPEVYLRLLYEWINQNTNGILHQRKKQLLAEVYKQLFESKKEKLIIKLGSKFQIVKQDRKVILLSKK